MNALLEKKEQAHREYYAQFVTPEIVRAVAAKFGSNLFKSNDPYLNDVVPIKPHNYRGDTLGAWDLLALNLNLSTKLNNKLRACNDFYSQDCGVCVLKEAARQIIDNQKK